MQHEGEPAVARVAERAGIPYALSTMGTTSIEDVAAAAPGPDAGSSSMSGRTGPPARTLMRRAAAAGYEALILTVDVPVAGARLRDVAQRLLAAPGPHGRRPCSTRAMHPNWWVDLLTTEPLEFASLTSWDGTVADLLNSLFDPTMTLEDLAWVRSVWDGPLIIKGIQTVADARAVIDAGPTRSSCPTTVAASSTALRCPCASSPEVRAALGDEAEIMLDTGVMSGADIVAALALGADSVMVGRAYLYGLMAGGEEGVQRAVDILGSEVRRTMALLGVRSVDELTPEHVTPLSSGGCRSPGRPMDGI